MLDQSKQIQTLVVRRAFPMVAYWNAKQAVRNFFEALVRPFEALRDATVAANETLQDKVFHQKGKHE